MFSLLLVVFARVVQAQACWVVQAFLRLLGETSRLAGWRRVERRISHFVGLKGGRMPWWL